MIKLENTVLPSGEQWEAIIRGMRNPMNSWDKSDSNYRPILCGRCDNCMSYQLEEWDDCEKCEVELLTKGQPDFMIGPNDKALMTKLAKAGSDHAKYRRMIVVYVDITAPLYWWKEFDTYKVGTVANSCSTMHKIHEKEFTLDDFSCERLASSRLEHLKETIKLLNDDRASYNWCNTEHKKVYWENMIQLLPSSYNQRRTVLLNYEVLANIYRSRKNHKLQEWRDLCEWVKTLPHSDLITMEDTYESHSI